MPFPTVVIAEILGVAFDQRDDFRRWSEHRVEAVFEPTSTVDQEQIARSGVQMGEWLDAMVAERQGSDGKTSSQCSCEPRRG